MIFAALRFTGDKNISDRLYWYLSRIGLEAGESVFAPVGTRNRLQLARVERVVQAEKENAPYDTALIKCVEARAEEKMIFCGEIVCRDLGGILYDDRHYTRFSRVAFCERERLLKEEEKALRKAGFRHIMYAGQPLEPVHGAVLIAGNGAKEYARKIILAARGKEHELQYVTLARLLL